MSTIKNSARCFNINKIYIITICQRTFNCHIAYKYLVTAIAKQMICVQFRATKVA